MIDIGPSSPIPVKVRPIGGIKHEKKFTRAGTVANRPVYHIINISTITTVLPRWFTKVVNHKKFNKSVSEQAFRKFRQDMAIIGLELSNQDIYNIESGYITVKFIYDGSPKDAAAQLKGDLRMFNHALREFKNKIKQYVEHLLDDYRITDLSSGRVIYCPIRPIRAKNLITQTKKLGG